MSASICALLGFTAWTLILVVSVVLYRTGLVFSFKKKANSWGRDEVTNDPAIIKRLAHAHANCVENLPVVAAIILVAAVTDQLAVTDGLACWLLAARVAQSTVHAIGVSHWLVFIRANFYFIQIGILFWWLIKLTGVA